MVRTEEVEVKTIAQILEDLDAPWQAGDFNGMWLNIQGSELAALRGAGDHLQHFDFVMLEINFDQRYDDCPLAEQIDAFMRERQFTPFSAYYFHQDYGLHYLHPINGRRKAVMILAAAVAAALTLQELPCRRFW